MCYNIYTPKERKVKPMALSKADEQKKIALMRELHLTEAEALDVIDADKCIDRGERMEFDLPPDKEKEAKKMANVTTRKKPITFDNKPRARKENPTKQSIIAELAKFLEEQSENATEEVTITNKERVIDFRIGDTHYSITLTQHRKPKT